MSELSKAKIQAGLALPNIKDLMDWGSARDVLTKKGRRIVRSAPITDEFWKLWETNKTALKEIGISISRHKGVWQVSWWQTKEENDATITNDDHLLISSMVTSLINATDPMSDDSTPKSISKEDATKLIDKYQKEQAAMG